MFAAVAERRRHPEQLVQELLDSRLEGCVDEPASVVETGLNRGEVHVPEDRDETELAHDRDQVLNHARSPEDTGGDTNQPSGLVDVLLQVRVEHVLEQAWIAVVVLGGDDHQRVRSIHRLSEGRVLRLLSCVVDRDRKERNVYQLRQNTWPLLQFPGQQLGYLRAHPALPGCPENDWNR